ncbi:MAG: FAD-dependent oxidoreductase [Acidobacteriia bacterium]|nr:FAD-dependent oxidoreductase [Terriglobia bacterium]
MKIAIVGAGIAGLASAYYLCRRHELTVFEASEQVGGHARTVRVKAGGAEYAVDTGFVVFNEANYPLFTGLLRELGVETQPTSMSFSVRSDRSGIEYNGSSLNGLFSQRRNLLRARFLRMLGDIARFQIEAPTRALGLATETSVESFLAAGGYGPGFVQEYLSPLGSALWSVPPGTFREFPIRFVVEFLANHGMLRWKGRPVWRVIRGGSCRYVQAVSRPFARSIACRTPVAAVERGKDGARVVDGRGRSGVFDHVILACHADQALQILRDPSPTEVSLLSAFPYQRNDAVLHTDPAPLPRSLRAWASWNYRVRREPAPRATVTYNMNRLQGLSEDTPLNVTLNDFSGIDERRILRRMRYEHPVFTSGRAAAQARHREVISSNRTSFCGAYWGYGFHEDGVRSAVAVCRALDPGSVR